MDNLTHSLVGLLIARGAPGPSVPRAAALCVIAANIPDLDIVSAFDPATYLVYHRHITHAVVAIPFMAALAVLLVNAWGHRSVRAVLWRQWALALAAVGSHVALDMMNSYGVRLWLPFSEEWSSWDLFFIIDPLIWALLAAAILVALRWPVRIAAARVGLAALVAYGLVSLWIRNGVEAQVARMVIAGQAPIELRMFPAPWTALDWAAYVRTESGQYSLNPATQQFTELASADANVLDELHTTTLGRAYLQFARFPVVVAAPGEITIGDVRFVRDGRLGFAYRFQVDDAGAITNGRFEF
ncbi:MAG: metal-dependent hydrolase [Acidobacteria bacterium]|nr:metal-dependent hydrolase [Acidobacteriota bacterium]MDA1234029.1 metal-dependent hydrolase [Acidobacteriota bacterium]